MVQSTAHHILCCCCCCCCWCCCCWGVLNVPLVNSNTIRNPLESISTVCASPLQQYTPLSLSA
uniref:Secreted protein n=1 Tax=Wuchereria bancrofti TaxID=6293 RepID=A0AAF5PM75_WUCBA